MKNALIGFFILIMIPAAAQWQELTPDTTFLHSRILFNSPTKGTVVGLNGVYMRTYDGGVTWDTMNIQFDDWSLCARSPYGSDLFAICFPSDTIGYMGGQDGDLFKTRDGGLTWFCQGMLPTLDNVEDVYFFNNDTGIAATVYTVFRTTDGGQTWTYQMPPLWPTRFAPVNDSTVLAGGAKIWRSADYGMTWSVTNCDTTIAYHDIEMIDSLNGIAVSWSGKISHTNDGGLNWSVPVSVCNRRITNIEMVNDTFGVITAGDDWYSPQWWIHDVGYVMYTVDGGQTWQTGDTIGTKTMLDLCIAGDTVAYTCGWLGNVMKGNLQIREYGAGTSDNTPQTEPVIYPNPATSTIFVSLPGTSSNAEITMYVTDLAGRTAINPVSFNAAPYQLDISSLSAGVYFLHCTVNGVESVAKFVVQ